MELLDEALEAERERWHRWGWRETRIGYGEYRRLPGWVRGDRMYLIRITRRSKHWTDVWYQREGGKWTQDISRGELRLPYEACFEAYQLNRDTAPSERLLFDVVDGTVVPDPRLGLVGAREPRWVVRRDRDGVAEWWGHDDGWRTDRLGVQALLKRSHAEYAAARIQSELGPSWVVSVEEDQ